MLGNFYAYAIDRMPFAEMMLPPTNGAYATVIIHIQIEWQTMFACISKRIFILLLSQRRLIFGVLGYSRAHIHCHRSQQVKA